MRVADDRETAEINLGLASPETFNATQLTALIEKLVAARADMSPALGGHYRSGITKSFQCDNLLWAAGLSAGGRAVELAAFQEGLGWLVLTLSRGQASDLAACIEFAQSSGQDGASALTIKEETGSVIALPLDRTRVRK